MHKEDIEGLKAVVDGIIGVAMFQMFSSYGVSASLESIYLFLTAKQSEILEGAKKKIPGFLMLRCNFYMNNKDEVMKWQI